jgi:hypothetical protein
MVKRICNLIRRTSGKQFSEAEMRGRKVMEMGRSSRALGKTVLDLPLKSPKQKRLIMRAPFDTTNATESQQFACPIQTSIYSDHKL